MLNFQTIRYEVIDDAIARVTLARPESRNAQNKQMTYELNEAFNAAARDDAVKAIILAADGPHFSAGHDVKQPKESWMSDDPEPIGTWAGYQLPGIEGYMAMEHEVFFGMCWRWRNIPKPVIATAQGKTIAGGLMLLWVCDIILASEEASFADPVVSFGVNGVEYFGHPWELGARKAKELLFTGDFITAQEAQSLGMVNQVVPLAELETTAVEMARRIATKPTFALKLAKESVNQTLDAQGFWTALRAAFSLQELGHANNALIMGDIGDAGTLLGDAFTPAAGTNGQAN
jgi:enoyl-CoA hydratase